MSLSTTRPTWAALGLNPGLCSETTARAMTRSFHILLFPYPTRTTASRLSSPPFSSSPLHFIIMCLFIFNVSHADVFIYTHTVQRISQTQQLLSHNIISGRQVSTLFESSSGPLKYRSNANNVHSAFWDPKCL